VTLPRNLIQTAFPNQPRMQQAFEALVTDAEDATARLNAALEAIGTLGDGAEGILAALADKQPKNAALTSISILGSDPGVLEQVQAGIYSIRPIDTADTAALMTRALADTRYLGGAHAAASATKLATARTITASGDAAWSVSFDGSANVSAALTLATVNANTGTFGGAKTSVQVSLDGKGRVTSASAVTITPDYSSIGIVPTSRFLGRVTAGTGSAEALTGTQATTLLDTFTSALKGLVPASGGGTANFLRADGTWAAAGSTVTPAALTKTDDTNVTLTLGGTPATALLQATSITVNWTGILAASRGGTANGFTAFSGPATSTKTFTLPNASDTIGCLGQAQTWSAIQTFSAVPVLSGGAIHFPATQVPSADVNDLDDYEEGTWTPVLAFGGATTGITTSAASGRYTKIGRMLFFEMRIVLTSKGSAPGNATITGLPFAVVGTTFGPNYTTQYSNMAAGFVTFPTSGTGITTPTQINLQNFNGTTNGAIADTAFTATSTINICGFYVAA
jgi:hypothetical protein